jgi:choline dehydrogenase-like flavoprotein
MPASGERFDVVVVGSGPVGAAVVREIHDLAPVLRLLLVEGGPQVTAPPGRHVKTVVDETERGLAQVLSQGPTQHSYEDALTMGPAQPAAGGAVRARAGLYLLGAAATQQGEDGMPAAAMASNVGGMGAHWSCACPRPGGSEVIPFIAEAEMDDLFRRAEQLLSVTTEAFAGAPLAEQLQALLGTAYSQGRPPERRVQPMPLAIQLHADGGRYWVGPDVVLGDILTHDRGTVDLRSETVARRIVFDGDRATAVELMARKSGEVYQVNADAVVVACDALRSPQLLFASGLQLPALGRYLNDQPQVVGLARIARHLWPAEPPATRAEAGQVEQFSGVTWIPFSDGDFPFHGQIVQMDASPIPIDIEDDVWPGSYVGVGLFGTKDLQPEDRVAVAPEEVDHFGLPAMRIHYRFTVRDREVVDAMKAEVRKIVAVIGDAVGDPEPILLPAGSSLHYQGSVRMGSSDDGTSVCDDAGRVWGTANVYVAGNGVIPTATACNPTLTSVALAVRSARRLVATLAEENR